MKKTYFDELFISTIIQEINKISEIEFLHFEKDGFNAFDEPIKTYLVKFKNEEDYSYMHLTYFPFSLKDGVGGYPVMFETLFGRFYMHDNSDLNMIMLKTKFNSFDDVKTWKSKFKEKILK